MTAIRIEIAGAGSFVVSHDNSEIKIQNDREFLLSMCKSHTENVEFFSISKCDVCISDRFESDEEQEAVVDAFFELWSMAVHYSATKEIVGDVSNLYILRDHCRAFEAWKESI